MAAVFFAQIFWTTLNNGFNCSFTHCGFKFEVKCVMTLKNAIASY